MTKNSPTTKIRVSGNRKTKMANCHKKLSPRKGLKFSPNNQKQLDLYVIP